MKNYAVFGNPVLHSRSPYLFNSAFAQLGIDAHYTRIRPNSGSQIADIIRLFPLRGANITTPFKESVMPYLQHISADAIAIGGVNTVVNADGELHGYNTDYMGVAQSLVEAGCRLNGCPCLVVGAGPAARAAIFGLNGAGAHVTVVNRTHEKAQRVAYDFGCGCIAVDRAIRNLASFRVVVSTLLPEANLLDGATYSSEQVLLDANYRQSAFSTYARPFGCTIIPGQRWLLHQAVAAYKLFCGGIANVAAMEQGFNVEMDRGKLRVEPLSSENILADLLIPEGDNFKTIVDEEVGKAFGC